MSRSSEALSQDYTMASAEMQELLLTFGGQSLTSQRLRPALLACTRPLGPLAFLALFRICESMTPPANFLSGIFMEADSN